MLHDDELTYAIIAPRALAPKNGCSVTGTYRWLATGWCEALRRLGVEAEVIGRRRRSHRRGGRASCYAAASTSDLCVNGRKLIGSAQARRRRAVLQHGSAPLRLRVADWNAVLVRAGDMEAATDLRTAAGREVTVSELQAAVIAGFRAALGVQFESDRLTPEEMLTARELEESRYRSEEWLHHRDRVRGGAAKESVREMPAGIDARSVI